MINSWIYNFFLNNYIIFLSNHIALKYVKCVSYKVEWNIGMHTTKQDQKNKTIYIRFYIL